MSAVLPTDAIQQWVDLYAKTREWVAHCSWQWYEQPTPVARIELVVHSFSETQMLSLLESLDVLERRVGVSVRLHWLRVEEKRLLKTFQSQPGDAYQPLFRIRQQVQHRVSSQHTRREVLSELEALEQWHNQLRDLFLHSPVQRKILATNLTMVFWECLRWASVFYNRVPGTREEELHFFHERMTQSGELFGEDVRLLAARLQLYAERAESLGLEPMSILKEDERERAFLHNGLQKVLGRLRDTARDRLTHPRERKRQQRNRTLLLWGSGGVLLLVALFWWGMTRPMSMQPLASFSQSDKAGAIQGVYFKDRDLKSRVHVRNDARIFWKWKREAPMGGVPKDLFSVRWKGFLRATTNGVYKICIRVDDGARLHLNGHLLIDQWKTGYVRSFCKKVHLSKGWYPLKVEMFEQKKDAEVYLSWEVPGTWKQVTIPSQNLCCRTSSPTTRGVK